VFLPSKECLLEVWFAFSALIVGEINQAFQLGRMLFDEGLLSGGMGTVVD